MRFNTRESIQNLRSSITSSTNKRLSIERGAYSLDDFSTLIAKYGSYKNKRKFFSLRKSSPQQVDVYAQVYPPYAGGLFKLTVYPNRRDSIVYYELAFKDNRLGKKVHT